MRKTIAFCLILLSNCIFSSNKDIQQIYATIEKVTELEENIQLETYKQLFLLQNNILSKNIISLITKTKMLKSYWQEQSHGFKLNPIKYFKKDIYKQKEKELKEKRELYLKFLGEITDQRKRIASVITLEDLEKFLMEELPKLNLEEEEEDSLDQSNIGLLCKNNINFLKNYKNYEKNQFKNLEKQKPYLKYLTLSTATILGIFLLKKVYFKNIKTPILYIKNIFQAQIGNPRFGNINPVENPNLLGRELSGATRTLAQMVLNTDNESIPYGSMFGDYTTTEDGILTSMP